MKRIISIKEYCIIVILCIICMYLAYLNLDYINNIFIRINSNWERDVNSLLLVLFSMILYIIIIIEKLLMKIRLQIKSMKYISNYNKTEKIFYYCLLGSIILIYYVTVFKCKYELVFLLSGGYVLVRRFFLHKIYVSEDYFVVGNKKYYFADIEDMSEDSENDWKIKVRINDKDHFINCMSINAKEQLMAVISSRKGFG